MKSRPIYPRRLLCMALVCSSSVCFAKTNEPPSQPAASVAALDEQVTRLVVDKDRNTVTVLIKGKEVGLFDSRGLHVTGDLVYTGFLQQEVAPKSGNNGEK